VISRSRARDDHDTRERSRVEERVLGRKVEHGRGEKQSTEEGRDSSRGS